MSARAISIDHYRSQARGQQSARVLGYICEHAHCTRQEISQGTGIPINCICGRVKELLDVGVIEERGMKRCNVTGNAVNALRVVPAQPELFAA